jgi:hypothetical protein
VVAVSVDNSSFSVRDVVTDAQHAGVRRSRVRPVGKTAPLYEEPHLVFGSLKHQK